MMKKAAEAVMKGLEAELQFEKECAKASGSASKLWITNEDKTQKI